MVGSSVSPSIPRFDLYGEALEQRDPGFVHIEDIADRSARHDWVIKPHRHDRLLQILFLHSGRVDLLLDEHHRVMDAPVIIGIPPGTVHGFSFSPNTDGAVLTLQSTVLMTDSGDREAEFEHLFAGPMIVNPTVDSDAMASLHSFLALTRSEFDRQETAREGMLRWLSKALLVVVVRLANRQRDTPSASADDTTQAWLTFCRLVDQHYREHWRVNDYAAAMHTSTSTLNRLCQATAGRTAKQIIQDRLATEIRRRLIYTRESLDGVAWSLGFKDPSYFSRFFKRQEGVSPREYRLRKYRETGTVC